MLLTVTLSACQKPHEKLIIESMSENPHYNLISISDPTPDCIDSTLWMPEHKISIGETDYYGPVQVVEHIYTKDIAHKDTISELWIFDESFKRPIFISQR